MIKNINRLYAYLGNCISCFLISAGLCILVNASFDAPLELGNIFLQVFLVGLALTVFLFNRFTAVFGGVTAVAGIIYLALRLKITEAAALVSFFNWCASELPQASHWYSAENIALIHTLINVGICLLIFLVARTPYRSALTVLLSLATICIVYLLGFVNYNRIAILLVFSGTLSLCATDKFEHRKHIRGKSFFTVLGRRWVVPAVSLFLCLLISGSALIVLDNDKKYDTRNRACSDIAADVQSFTGVYTDEQKDFEISLFDLGLQSNKGFIGGNLPEREHALLALTDLDTTFNVRVTTFDIYTGKQWKTDFKDSYRINGPFEEKQIQCLSSNILSKASNLSSLKNIIFYKKVQFVLNVDSPFLPSIGQVHRFTENSNTRNPNLFNANGQLFSYYGQKRGYTYTLDTINFNINANLDQGQVMTLNAISSKRDPVYTKAFVEKYTKTSQVISNIDELIQRLKLNPEYKYNTACRVANYFSKENGYSYVTTGLEFNENDNVTSQIFKTKKGHCVYYSTVAINILRQLKIPCRLAAGYRTVKISDDAQVIDSAYPYCWVECYFPNLGWVSFDPSPEHKIDFSLQLHTYKGTPAKPKVDKNVTKADKKTLTLPEIGKLSLSILWISLAVALVYLIARGFWTAALYSLNFVAKRFKSIDRQCVFYLRDIERQLKALGFVTDLGDTLREQILKTCDILGEEDCQVLISALEIGEDLYYGGKMPDDNEVQQLYKARLILENALKNRLNPVMYLLKRRVLLPVL